MKIGQGSCINTLHDTKNAVAVFKSKPVKTIRPVLKQLDTVLGEINFAAAGAHSSRPTSSAAQWGISLWIGQIIWKGGQKRLFIVKHN